MKSFELVVQEKWNFCLCCVLQAIFKKYGLTISQEEIAENLTPKTKGFAHDDLKIKEFMARNKFSYSCFWAHETPFNEPDGLLEEMCEDEGIIGINTHVYLLKDFQHPRLKIIDPKNGREFEKEYSELLKEMGYDGFFGLIKYIF